MVSEHGHDLIICCCGSTVGVIRSEVQIIYGSIRLAKGTGSITTSCYKFPNQRLCCQPLFIVTTCQAVTIALIAIKKCQSNSFLLTIRKSIPCFRRISGQLVAGFQRNTGMNTKGGVAIHIHSILGISNTTGSIAVDLGTGVVIHRIAVCIISVGECYRAYIIGCRKRSCRQEG